MLFIFILRDKALHDVIVENTRSEEKIDINDESNTIFDSLYLLKSVWKFRPGICIYLFGNTRPRLRNIKVPYIKGK